jgi:hypothetical protein
MSSSCVRLHAKPFIIKQNLLDNSWMIGYIIIIIGGHDEKDFNHT